jgi:cell division protein ZapA (FtsZ GTPase activity inhibitor)
MKEKLTLVVSGIKIDIVTEDDPEYVKGLGRLLEKRVSDLVISSASRQKNEALLLCALDYLDERNKLKAENEELKKELIKFKKLK